MKEGKLELTTVGGGCFWCMEALFAEVAGVETVISGFSGGNVPGTPTYREVCSGLTGHAEVVQVSFDAHIISYNALLHIFMTSHDPTTLNRKGSGHGSQYRSVIYVENDTQRKIAEAVKKEVIPCFERAVTTEISPAEKFHPAEEGHQSYFATHPTAGYCTAIITPKLLNFRKMHAENLKTVTP